MAGRHPSRSLIGVRRKRRKDGVKFRLIASRWTDPYPDIPGTVPEKMIFAELVLRGIYFIFQGEFPKRDVAVQVTADDPGFKPDFIVPEWKVIFDPFGDYHHSTEEGRIRDTRKMIFYEATDYEFLHPWSSDVEKYGPSWVISLSKRLAGPPMFTLDAEDQAHKAARGYRLGVNLGAGAGGVGAANRARARRGLPTKPRRLRPAR